MKLALNGATTMRADLATDLEAAKAAGFDYLEIWAAKLRNFLKERPTTELKDIFAESGLKPLSINSIEHITFRDDRAYESIKKECEELSSIAAAVGCPCIVVVPGPLPKGGASRESVISESTRVLTELCEISAAHDAEPVPEPIPGRKGPSTNWGRSSGHRLMEMSRTCASTGWRVRPVCTRGESGATAMAH